jgi:hypothetical protein
MSEVVILGACALALIMTVAYVAVRCDWIR